MPGMSSALRPPSPSEEEREPDEADRCRPNRPQQGARPGEVVATADPSREREYHDRCNDDVQPPEQRSGAPPSRRIVSEGEPSPPRVALRHGYTMPRRS